MNYYPYFRGKQFELICIRENAELIAEREYKPIIEPVRDSSSGLLKAIDSLRSENASFYIVSNPAVGPHANELPREFVEQIEVATSGYERFNWLYQIEDAKDFGGISRWLEFAPKLALLHHGAVPARDVLAVIPGNDIIGRTNIFTESCSTRYRSSFGGGNRVILSDGFKKRRNADYPDVELFSELRVTFQDLGAGGFGDYLIVGSDYSEGGGAAYAVAIHITYVDNDDDGVIYIRHFVSDTNDTPADPAGKFGEALGKLIHFLADPNCEIPNTLAIQEFRKLHEFGHYPGLGYVKKLSMQHHLEIIG